jgi:site-specific DNA-methyltransferase (adenine-specific)
MWVLLAAINPEDMMGRFWTNGIATLYQADARQIPIPDQSVHCVVTSPPYFGLRVYRSDSDAMIGLEETIPGWIDSMLEVMAEVGRVLRDDGGLWVNLGDSYGEAGQLLMIPARFALAMQDAGWILRSDVIWAKKSPMPESVAGTRWERCRVKVGAKVNAGKQATNPASYDAQSGGVDIAQYTDCPGCPKCADTDGLVLRSGSWRCTSSHEHIFQFVKSMGYYSDGEAVKTASPYHVQKQNIYTAESGHTNGIGSKTLNQWNPNGANRRNVWSDISPEPYGGEHYATFPSDLPRLCIQASTSEAGVCSDCGSQWARVVDATEWRPTCTCNADKVPATVLDPFAGTGTTLLAAMRLGRRSFGVDLSTDYLGQAVKRLGKQSLPMLI